MKFVFIKYYRKYKKGAQERSIEDRETSLSKGGHQTLKMVPNKIETLKIHQTQHILRDTSLLHKRRCLFRYPK